MTAEAAEYKDMFGREIKVGDYIIYAGVDGRSGVLRAGRVLKLTVGKSGWEKTTPKVTCDTWNYGNTVEWDHKANPSKATPFVKSGRQSKAVTLGFLERMIVVPEDYVHAKVKEDLANPAPTYGW
jgi:hypothetical protein